jgi:iron uptake system component EfeO
VEISYHEGGRVVWTWARAEIHPRAASANAWWRGSGEWGMLGGRDARARTQYVIKRCLIAWLAMAALACGGGVSPGPTVAPKSDAEYRAETATAMHDALVVDLGQVVKAVTELQAAAPLVDDRGWDEAADAAAITTMRAAWFRARNAYEHVEGAIAPLFPDLSNALDSRYEDQLATLGAAGDPYLFDDKGVRGLDAVERILYADATPAHVVAFERALVGYHAAAFPANEAEARDFKHRLCQKLVDDATALAARWNAEPIDVRLAFGGLVSLVTEQSEELERAAEGAEESRYSQKSMEALRANLEGTEAISGLFREWLVGKSGGSDLDQKIIDGLHQIEAQYAAVDGLAIPQPPATWNSSSPSPQDLATPFGQLYTAVSAEVDPNRAGTLPWQMLREADLLGISSP